MDGGPNTCSPDRGGVLKVMIVVTHLLGTGHLARALTLARAFQARGDQVTVVSGGLPVPHLNRGDVPLVQLPAIRSDGANFSRLHTQDGDIATEATLNQRQKILLETFKTERPDALITELYPFGRRILHAEFTALLDTAHAMPHRPIVCASIRDILAPPSKPKKADATHVIIAERYDNVLVHSDATLMPLDLSWPVTSELQAKLQYTGFVAPPAPAPHPEKLGTGEIIVSAGGGDVGRPLFECTLKAASDFPDIKFRLLAGGSESVALSRQLNDQAPKNVFAEPARADFRQMLNHAEASVSLCGYNTALDILQTGCPAIFLPYDAGNEVEQSIRARALTHQNGITTVNNATLTPRHLSDAIAKGLAEPRRAPHTSSMDGATHTQRIVQQLIMQNQ